MAEKSENLSPPYCTFGSFINFINDLRETGIPPKIDSTVFGTKSGGTIYSILAALKSLKMTNEDGVPTQRLSEFVASDENSRKRLMREILEDCYDPLFGDKIDLKTASAGQFNDTLRDEYQISGSTIDKVASFFLSAAKMADVEISHFLQKRKAIASSPSSRRSTKQRSRSAEQKDNGSNGSSDQVIVNAAPKKLQYQLIDLMAEPDFPDDIKDSIWKLVQYLTMREAKNSASTETHGNNDIE